MPRAEFDLKWEFSIFTAAAVGRKFYLSFDLWKHVHFKQTDVEFEKCAWLFIMILTLTSEPGQTSYWIVHNAIISNLKNFWIWIHLELTIDDAAVRFKSYIPTSKFNWVVTFDLVVTCIVINYILALAETDKYVQRFTLSQLDTSMTTYNQHSAILFSFDLQAVLVSCDLQVWKFKIEINYFNLQITDDETGDWTAMAS